MLRSTLRGLPCTSSLQTTERNSSSDVAQRSRSRARRGASVEQLQNGVPLFLEQLTRTLRAEEDGQAAVSLRISGPSGGDTLALSEMGVSAAAHGKVLLGLGFTVDQVVHDYGDLCQAITDLAVERDAPFSIDEYRTLNRCLDNAIADAVTEFARQRDIDMATAYNAAETQRLGSLVHELRNHLSVAMMAFSALETGTLTVGGSTGGVVKRALTSMRVLVDESVAAVRTAGGQSMHETFSVATFIADARTSALLYAASSQCTLEVPEVNPALFVCGNRMLLAAALTNLLQNAFKFTHPHTQVTLSAEEHGDRVLIAVRDHCGGLPPAAAETLFKPFTQVSSDRSGLGLGLSIALKSVEADGGRLRVQDLPGEGCIFSMDLPRAMSSQPADRRP